MLVAIETPHSLIDWMGREIAVTDWFRVSHDRIQSFANVTEDHQWIHWDREVRSANPRTARLLPMGS